jgi:Raf kinase inhibitor-like YbhB/YbcL family protein
MLSKSFQALFIAGLLVACSDDGSTETSDDGGMPPPESEGGSPEAAPAEFVFESPAFETGGMIPAMHRCDNAPSPPLEWSGAPSGTASFAIVMKDLDFQNGFLHWVIYDIPASESGLPEGVPEGYAPAMPAGAHQASVIGQTGYFGPCSPASTNTYQFTLYAVDVATLSGLTEATPAPDVVTQIEDHAIESRVIEGESGP